MELKIDNELCVLIPPLQKEEYELLEKSIIKEGCRDALIVWSEKPIICKNCSSDKFKRECIDGQEVWECENCGHLHPFTPTIIDGHNRYEICRKHNIEFETKELEFDNKEDVKDWIDANQLGRRNLTDDQRQVLIGRRYNREKNRQGGTGANQYNKQTGKLAKEYKVSDRTVKNYAKVAEFYEQLEQEQPEVAKEVWSGKTWSGKTNLKKVKKEVKKKEREQQRKKIAEEGSKIKIDTPLICGDFYTSDIKDNSIDLILTDPPYPGEFLDQWDRLGEFADRVLKPSKFLIAYSGQLNLNKTIQLLNKSLIYYWTFALVHKSNKQLIMPRNIFCGWKPLLVFQKKPYKKLEDKIEDIISGSGREKNLHDWAQAEDELKYIIENFTIENEIILDPFAGSGTTLVVAKKSNRKSIGIDINEENIKIIKRRLSDAG